MKVLEIRVLREEQKIALTIEMPLSRYHTAQAPHVPRRLLRLFPRMARHTCHNDSGKTFRQEARHTEIPHLFEHLLVELQLQAQHADDLTLRGITEWNWQRDPQGRFHVLVEYENEILAVGAIHLAVRIMTRLDNGDLDELNTDREVEMLRDLARLGRALNGDDPLQSDCGSDKSAVEKPAMLTGVPAPTVSSPVPVPALFVSAPATPHRSSRCPRTPKSAKPPRAAVVVAHRFAVAAVVS